MQTIHSITTVVNSNRLSLNLSLKIKNNLKHHHHHHHQPFSSHQKFSHCEIPTSLLSSSPPQRPGLCKASQVAEFFPTTSPEIVIREAGIEDSWGVAETHCTSFFPKYSFPLDFALRVNRLISMTLLGFSVPKGCKKICLVAVIGSSDEDTFFLGSDDFKNGDFYGTFSPQKGYVVGILTLDTIANFLPRKGRERRTGIAYISNVAVRERFRKKGIAKRLVAKAEKMARSWGCRVVALHCDLNDSGPTMLYASLGFKNVKVPEGANWPRPKTSPDVRFGFMMKLLGS